MNNEQRHIHNIFHLFHMAPAPELNLKNKLWVNILDETSKPAWAKADLNTHNTIQYTTHAFKFKLQTLLRACSFGKTFVL